MTARQRSGYVGLAALISGITVLVSGVALKARPHNSVAAHWIILFEGEGPGSRIVFSDWELNNRLMHAIARPAAVDARSLASRSSVRVALFWGPEWHNWRVRWASIPIRSPLNGRINTRVCTAAQPAIRPCGNPNGRSFCHAT